MTYELQAILINQRYTEIHVMSASKRFVKIV